MSEERINILAVDDSPAQLLAMEAILTNLGQNLVTASSGREALRQLLHQDFAVILLDVNMPGMDGFETAKLIRERKNSAHTPIIFVTGNGDDTRAFQGYSLGAVDYLLTPVVPEVLRAKVGVFVELYRKSAQIREQADERVALAQEQGARRAAEEANRAKSVFLANISHELRTPLQAIMGMTELALEEPLTPDALDYLRTVMNSAEVLLSLLNEILDFSRLEASRLTLESNPFALRETLNQTLKSLSIRAYEKGIELAWEIDPEIPDDLVGDPLRLRQILTNLIGNAIKFTAQGEAVLRVSQESRTDEGIMLVFCIRDTGIGISREHQKAIFTPFMQADSSTTRKYGGTGLGLSIAAHLIALMKGRPWLESELGRGTSFYFNAQFALARETKPQRPPAFAAHLVGQQVLVADDNATNREILDRALRRLSLEPTLVADGSAAIDALRAAAAAGKPFPLVILDALMPGIDGFAVADEMQTDPRLAGATVLMISAADRHVFSERCEQLGFDAYLEKPIAESELYGAIAQAVGVLPDRAGHDGRPSRGSPNAASKLRILVAEDTPANQKLIHALLSKRGHEVAIAHNGREAVEMLRQQHFDTVLMDLQMPIMDGFQATATIRATQPVGTCPRIIAITAYAMRDDEVRCLAAGMDAYLSKPLDYRKLIETIEAPVDHLNSAHCG